MGRATGGREQYGRRALDGRAPSGVGATARSEGRHFDPLGFAGIVGRDSRMRELFAAIRQVANAACPVLIQGETGTGKELVARAIHDAGPRAAQSFVPVPCGAIPEGLLESELFGHVKGAFTGAVRDRLGRFGLADRGTIFLDEVAELSPLMQVKLLRVLQERSFEPVGSEQTTTVDVRVVSATHKDLGKEVAAGRFRSDLYYRLSVYPLSVPPLRERVGDLPLLVEHFVGGLAAAGGLEAVRVSRGAMAVLTAHGWPGNVRELQNALEYAVIRCRGHVVKPEHLPASLRQGGEAALPAAVVRPRRALTVAELAAALAAANGNKRDAAKALGVGRATLYRFLAASGSTHSPKH
jgi:sigma-54 dependent transcriptional regulator, acetoin dehydrogenase operon transcriptional activator AcoR